MNICKILAACVVCLFLLAAPAGAASAGGGPSIRVGLWDNQSNLLIVANGKIVIRDRATQKVLGKYNAGARLQIAAAGKEMRVNKKKVAAAAIEIELAKPADDQSIGVNRKTYRGAVEIFHTPRGAGLTAVNVLPFEQYLYSIVPGEMPVDWPMEAIKAQAVAARSYALSSMGRHSADGYDVCSSTHCQVYGGKGAERDQATRAVDATRGEAMLYQGKPIEAVFHSSGGGFTENSENVWGAFIPYLRGVVDYDQKSPHYQWKKELTPREIQKKLQDAGYQIGALQAIELSPLKDRHQVFDDRGVSGRVKHLSFIGDKGGVRLTGSQARSVLGLKSALFDIELIVPSPKGIDVPIVNSVGMTVGVKTIEVDLPPRAEERLLTDKITLRRVTGRPGEIAVIHGFGWGHGLGLSQWGAKAMAEKAKPGDTTYYRTILRHYYTNVTIKKVY